MNIDYIIIFTILICSFILSKYFAIVNNPEVQYPKKDYLFLSFIISLVAWILFIFNLSNELIYSIFIIIMSLLMLKELIFVIIKINYFDKKFKIILRQRDYNGNKNSLRREMGVVSLRNIFYILAAPLLVIEYIITILLNKIFGGEEI